MYCHQAIENKLGTFILSKSQIANLAECFRKSMLNRLNGSESSLKMLPAFLDKPTGEERGRCIAVDFGGSKIRLLIVHLKGHREYEITKEHTFLLKDPHNRYNFTTASTTGSELFAFIVSQIVDFIDDNSIYPLGHTFSFPTLQRSSNDAILIKWTKEIKTSGVEGINVTDIFKTALLERKYHQIIPKVIINDTTGTLLTSSYNDPNTDLGSICGTGHNTCYFESDYAAFTNSKIINIESGNFNELPYTEYDNILDINSDMPGEQRLEKMVGGKYIGELFRIIVESFMKGKLLFKNCQLDAFSEPYLISSQQVSIILEDISSDLNSIKMWLMSMGIDSLLEDRLALRLISSRTAMRAGQLVAATYIGILTHIDPGLLNQHIIAIDGSVYEHLALFADTLRSTLNCVLGNKAKLVSLKLTKDGSGIGAAIGAAMNT